MSRGSLAVFRVMLQNGIEGLNGVLVVLALGVDVANVILRVRRELRIGKILQIVGELLHCQIVAAAGVIAKSIGVGRLGIHPRRRTGRLGGGSRTGSAYSGD